MRNLALWKVWLFRTLFYGVIIGVILFFSWRDIPFIAEKVRAFEAQSDGRPVKKVLFIGNSRTFHNDVPGLWRKIARSDQTAPYQYQIVMHALPSYTLKNHWDNQETLAKIDEGYDAIIVQGQGGEQLNPAAESSFQTHGMRLLQKIKAAKAQPVLYVSWAYSPDSSLYTDHPYYKGRLHFMMRESYAKLAASVGGVDCVQVGEAFEQAKNRIGDLSLYDDETHPSVAGAYLAALSFHRYFTGKDLSLALYAPAGISLDQAAKLRDSVNSVPQVCQ